DLAPKTAAALWDDLPVEDLAIRNVMWSGEACFFDVPGRALVQLPELPELGVTSMYKGFMMVAPPNPTRQSAELLLSYGVAESRGRIGPRPVTPVAEIDGDGTALLDVLRRIHDEGRKTVTVRRATT